MTVEITWRPNAELVEIYATRNGDEIGISALLPEERLRFSIGISRLAAALENGEDGQVVSSDGDRYLLTPDFVQHLGTDQARCLGLPPDVPFSLWVRLSGAFVSPATRVSIAWHDSSGSSVSVREEFGFLRHGSKFYRIPALLGRILGTCRKFNESGGDLDQRLTCVSELKSALENASGEVLGFDKQLEAMRFRHASAVSLDVSVGADGVQFDPIFFSEDISKVARERGDSVREEDSLLPPELQRSLARQFKEASKAKPTYVLARGEYLYVEPALRTTLDVIKEYQSKGPEERAKFVRSPQSFIKARHIDAGLSEEAFEDEKTKAFVETDTLSERVIEIGLWHPPVLPFVQRAENNWFPEAFGLKIGDRTILVPEQQLEPLAHLIAQAITNQIPEVAVPGTFETVPVSRGSLDAVNAMLEFFLKVPAIVPTETAEERGGETEKQIRSVGAQKSILIVQDNFEAETFVAQFRSRSKYAGFERPPNIRTSLKEHQIAGVDWLQRTWSIGYPGVLLADDMGLGKTLQTLAFVAWLRQKRHQEKLPDKPVLIVAPISLLGNWQAEVDCHLERGGLGEMACLYGEDLREFRKGRYKRADVMEGISTLDVASLRSYSWVLTTYETMRDYHLSLGLIDFAMIAFDEMQKIKNPKAMMTNAAQALQGEYKIGLTGTPIENSLADIWTLFDTLMPGALGIGNLKQFVEHYRLDKPDALIELKKRLTESTPEKPAPMLRRMKSDVAKDLPRKIELKVPRVMPEVQAVAYVDALRKCGGAATKRGRLDAFHRIRSVSLHPSHVSGELPPAGEDYVANSARLTSCLTLLDEIHGRGEKALVFCESLAMQEWLAYYLRERYQLDHYPARIFGETSAERRTAIVERFQSSAKGTFDLLLLSPKAAGVGLTLTAATHVIHLTRWWNPAVEDQCTDRAYRIGQTKDVRVYYLQSIHPLYGDGSFDFILDQLLERKRSLSVGMLVPQETGDELEEMLRTLAGTL